MISVRSIDLDEDGKPTKVGLVCDAADLFRLGLVVGPTNGPDRDALLPGWGDSGTDWYDAASFAANAFYDGLLDWERENTRFATDVTRSSRGTARSTLRREQRN